MASQVISILLPTRNRRERFEQTLLSILKTISTGDAAEVLVYVSDCDHSYDHFASTEFCKFIRGPRVCFSDLWNQLAPHAKGDILMLCADDVIFRTANWDLEIEKAFAAVPDKILLAFADDGGPNGKTFSALPFISRRWYEIIGYFTPSGYSADFCDTHLWDVSRLIDRTRCLPHVLIEHMHYIWSKAEQDQTYKENVDRWQRDRPDLEYARRSPERIADADKLRKAMQ
jgi:glycosyltransferase involved in cell wall biosynthesis